MLRFSRLTFIASALAVSALLSVGCGGDGTAGPQGPAGPPGAPGDKGDKGDPGDSGGNADPQVSLVTPGTLYLNRRVDVTIAGDNTKWDNSVDVDFGDGITVDGVFATPSSIIATITIDETAEVGFHDVVVSGGPEGSMPITYPEAVFVAPPIEVPGYLGTLAQGSIFISRIHLADLSTPFDSAGAPDYPYVSVTASSPGIDPQVQEAQPFTIDLLTFVDVDAAAGDTDIRVSSGLTGGEVESLAPKALPIAARSPVVITAGQPTTGTVMEPLQTILYSYTPGPNKLVTIESTSADPAATPSFALLPSSGSFADLISYGTTGTIMSQSADPIYIVVWDNTGASGYSFDINVSAKDTADVEPNDACDKAQAVASLPAALQNLSLSSGTDEDWFAIDIPAADVGKVLHVVTSPGDPNTDTFVDVFAGPCNNLSSLGGPSSDADYHEDFTSKAIPAAGKIYVKISQSPAYPFAGSAYNVDFELLQTEVEPNSTCGEATTLSSFPTDIQGASLDSAADQDWYVVNIGAADVGKSLKIDTLPGEPNTDTFVEVFSGDCVNLVSFAVSSDANYHESLLTDPLPAAGTYFVKISASSFGFAGKAYNLGIKLVLPAEIEPNNTCAQANPGLMLGQDVGPLYMPDNMDEDWFTFIAAAGDVGKVVHVMTKPGEANTDPVVEVFEGACAGLVSLGVSDDSDYHENLLSAPITAAGPIYVKVSYTQAFNYAGAEYMLNVVLE